MQMCMYILKVAYAIDSFIYLPMRNIFMYPLTHVEISSFKCNNMNYYYY
jgi:hypothetical protein